MGDCVREEGEGEWVGETGRECHPWTPCLSRSYIWQHIEIGYVQGMCDLLAPLLVILDDGEYVLPTQGQGRNFLPTAEEGMLTSFYDSMEWVSAGAQRTCW